MSGAEKPDSNKSVEGEPEKDVLVTPDGEELDLSIVGTMKIDPDQHSPVSNPSRLKSLKYAIAGLLYVLVREQSIKLAMVVSGITVIVGLWLQIGTFSWALLVVALGAVWVTECLNTAIEASIDLGTSDPHPMAKVGKDVASAAALVSSLVFVMVVALILLPRLIEKLSSS
jgi:diacylglycerol kinase